ncbi:MAG: cysteine methyltransferase [Candidatus Magasanikbacteria bacterium GW2011_GWA2_56_11]|uniref:methylated-DNA--[protein]-cysteine S-methyltransferase n=1 Tax=Candidatus Magasanikbacteria bacterium GW2011_GWA2_56_11 TaxID=1619044 RepID=A0A0G1YF11_9BACT|nr:MAG: cysteine methyltransferase [Candidatus Magasanikbacteria bacterium GW2011_GWA2_56_11]
METWAGCCANTGASKGQRVPSKPRIKRPLMYQSVSFAETVYRLLLRVPAGRVTTYAALARAAGSVRAVRAVGNALHRNPRPVAVPCHRVVRSSGSLGGYVRGKEEKKRLLEAEGVEVADDRVDLSRYGLVFDVSELFLAVGSSGERRTPGQTQSVVRHS